MKNISLSNFGPIKEANIKFGDLTILIGPQASGKSVLLQLAKLLKDKRQIRNTLNQYALPPKLILPTNYTKLLTLPDLTFMNFISQLCKFTTYNGIQRFQN